MPRLALATTLAATALLGAAAPALADDDPIVGHQVHWDNDVWAKGRTDRWYTNGLRYSWTYGTPPGNAFTKAMLEGSRWLLWPEAKPTLTYTIGQNMYTPRDITEPAPQPDDRPWGAFLFFGATSHAHNGDHFRATELKLGSTGRAALGEPAQKGVHVITGSDEPQGWDQQLRPRLGVQLSHARVYRAGDSMVGDRIAFQAGWGVAVGTLRNYANVNLAMMVGDLEQRNTPILVGNEGDFVVQDFDKRPQFEKLYGFVALGYTGVAYNYFLEGSTPYGKAQIDTKPGHALLQWGVSLPLQRWFSPAWPRLVYTQTARTAEFSSPALQRNESVQRWGTFSLHWDRL